MTDTKPEAPPHEGECSFRMQPFADDGTPNDRDHCRIPGCGKPRTRNVIVDESLFRDALRDALAFSQALANSGDPEAPDFVAQYETALLRLADAPEADPAALRAEASASAVIASLESKLAEAVAALVLLAQPDHLAAPSPDVITDATAFAELDARILYAAGVLEHIARPAGNTPPVLRARTEWGVAYEGDETADLFGVREYDDRDGAERLVREGLGDVVVTRTVTATPWRRAEVTSDVDA